jgi:GNAT acetyltransferase-like protein
VKRPSIQVCPYDPSQSEPWDRFIADDSRNGGLFHERRFLSYHAPDRFRDVSLMFRDETGQLMGVLPCAQVDLDGGGRAVESHPGSSAGSFVFSRTARLSHVLSMVEGTAMHFRDAGFSRIGLRLPEPIFAGATTGELDFALWHQGFRLRTRELSTAIRLGDEAARTALARKKMGVEERAAQKRGVTVAQSDDTCAVWEHVARNLRERYGKSPAHSASELAHLKQQYPTRIRFWCASRDGVMLAVIVVFEVTARAAHTFYIAHDRAAATDVNPMPLLVSTICDDLTARNFSWLNFGISTRGDYVKWGILEFKEFMGGRGVCREEWELSSLTEFKPYEWPA